MASHYNTNLNLRKMKTIQSYITILLSIAAILVACRKMDDYKDKYLTGGSITYTGKIDSVRAHPGDGRSLYLGAEYTW